MSSWKNLSRSLQRVSYHNCSIGSSHRGMMIPGLSKLTYNLIFKQKKERFLHSFFLLVTHPLLDSQPQPARPFSRLSYWNEPTPMLDWAYPSCWQIFFRQNMNLLLQSHMFWCRSITHMGHPKLCSTIILTYCYSIFWVTVEIKRWYAVCTLYWLCPQGDQRTPYLFWIEK